MDAQPILLVEDDDDTADAIIACMRRAHLDNTVVVAATGKEAIAWLAAHPTPALVLLDLGLPDMRGFEVLRHVRATAGTRLAVLIVTASNDDDDRAEAARLDANGYVLKTEVATALIRAARELPVAWLLTGPTSSAAACT